MWLPQAAREFVYACTASNFGVNDVFCVNTESIYIMSVCACVCISMAKSSYVR